jgi:hypothetical protein
MAIYSTTAQQGIDVNQVFYLDLVGSPEYPAPPFQPGELAWGTDGSEWVYCQCSTAINAGAAVLISPSIAPGYNLTQTFGVGTWSVSPVGGTVATPALGQLVGVVGGGTGQVTVTAPSGTQTAAYFWVQRAGNVPNLNFGTQAGATGTVNALLHSTPTLSATGAVQTVSGGTGTTYQITGLVFSNATASVAGPNSAIANYPTVGSAA